MSTALAALGRFTQSSLPGGELVWHLINFGVSFAMITLLFALMFKVIPDVKIGFRDVGIGAAATALSFVIGKFLLGLYLGKSSVASSSGAAGSLVVLVIWVYCSAQTLFFGAEFTQADTRHRGSRITPSKNAVSVEEKERESDDERRRPGPRRPAHA